MTASTTTTEETVEPTAQDTEVVEAVSERLGGDYVAESPRDVLNAFTGGGGEEDGNDAKGASDTQDTEGNDKDSQQDIPDSAEDGSEATEDETPDGLEHSGPSQAMVGLAQDAGVPDETIRALGTDDALRVYLRDFMQKDAARKPGGETRTGPEPVEDFAPFEWDVQIDPADMSDEFAQFANAAKANKEHVDKYLSTVGKQVKELQGVLMQISQGFQRQQAQQDQQWFEGQVKALLDKEPEWKQVFGATTYAGAKSKKHRDAWNEAFDEVLEMATRNQKRTNPLDPEQLFLRAVNAVHGDRAKELARKALDRKDRDMAEDHASLPPTDRKGKHNMHSFDRAVTEVTQYLNKKKR